MNLGGNELGSGGPKVRPPLRVWLMAAALVIAAFLGAAIGLVWQNAGFDEDAGPAEDDSGAGEASEVRAEASG